HLEAIDTVLELVVLAEILGGQLAALPYRHESGMQPKSERSPDDETARFDRGDFVDRPAVVGRDEAVDHRLERLRILEQRRDVAKHHARPRKVRHRADLRLEIQLTSAWRVRHRDISSSSRTLQDGIP